MDSWLNDIKAFSFDMGFTLFNESVKDGTELPNDGWYRLVLD